jgi:hypothetical protein
VSEERFVSILAREREDQMRHYGNRHRERGGTGPALLPPLDPRLRQRLAEVGSCPECEAAVSDDVRCSQCGARLIH